MQNTISDQEKNSVVVSSELCEMKRIIGQILHLEELTLKTLALRDTNHIHDLIHLEHILHGNLLLHVFSHPVHLKGDTHTDFSTTQTQQYLQSYMHMPN